MRRQICLILGLALGIGVATAPATAARPSVNVQTMPGVNFANYKTFSFLKAIEPEGGSPVVYQEIINDFAAALIQKGYQQVSTGGDLSLVVSIGARNKTQFDSWGFWGLQTSVWQYTVGQLSLDAFDGKTKQALWHGTATETIDPNKPNQGKIDEAIQKMMAQFPPSAAAAAAPGSASPQ